MFQPQPTPYSSFYPAYLPVGVEDDGLSDGFGGVQASGYSTYPQAPFASLSLGGPGPQVGAPGPPASGSGPAGGSCHDAHGGATGVPVDVRSAPLPVFPFHSTLPLHQHHQPGAPNLFDHRQPPSLQHRQRHQQHKPAHAGRVERRVDQSNRKSATAAAASRLRMEARIDASQARQAGKPCRCSERERRHPARRRLHKGARGASRSVVGRVCHGKRGGSAGDSRRRRREAAPGPRQGRAARLAACILACLLASAAYSRTRRGEGFGTSVSVGALLADKDGRASRCGPRKWPVACRQCVLVALPHTAAATCRCMYM